MHGATIKIINKKTRDVSLKCDNVRRERNKDREG
jgi:hypothetical protein